MNRRLIQLDSLRGLAAFSVLIYHFTLVFEPIYRCDTPDGGAHCRSTLQFVAQFTPWHFFWVGHEAVIFFFVLSGFVLALPYLKEEVSTPYGAYAVKRVLRIYPPYWCAIAFAIAANQLFYHATTDGLPSFWPDTIGRRWTWDWRVIWDHLLLVGSFNFDRFLPPIWSLVHEMRVSLIFPFLAWAVRRWHWRTNLALGLGLAVTHWVLQHLRFRGWVQFSHNYFTTLDYVGFFILGAVLAKHRASLVRVWGGQRRPLKYLFAVVGLAAYTHAWWLTRSGLVPAGRLKHLLELEMVATWITAAGIVIFIVAALASDKVTGLLTNAIPQFLGKVSYSLYLYHLTCLVLLLNLLSGRVSLWLILLAAAALSLALSALSYYAVELPAMNAGRWITGKWTGRRLREFGAERETRAAAVVRN